MAKLQTEADANKITTAPKTNNQPTNTTEPSTEATINQPQSDNTILYAIIAGLSVLVLAILGLLIYQNFKNSKTDNQVNSNSPDEATTDEK
jgi:hypothetical protein